MKPTVSAPPGLGLYMGIHLGDSQIEATIVDDKLNVIDVIQVDFARELPQQLSKAANQCLHSTQITSELLLTSIDLLFSKLTECSIDLRMIRSISPCATRKLSIFWGVDAPKRIGRLDPSMTIESQLKNSIILPSQLHQHTLETCRQVGRYCESEAAATKDPTENGSSSPEPKSTPSLSEDTTLSKLVALHSKLPEVFKQVYLGVDASSFLASVLTTLLEKKPSVDIDWSTVVNKGSQVDKTKLTPTVHELLMRYVGIDALCQIMGKLAKPETNGSVLGTAPRATHLANYWKSRYGFAEGCVVGTPMVEEQAAFLAFNMYSQECLLNLDECDTLIMPTLLDQCDGATMIPHPFAAENLGVMVFENGTVTREYFRDIYNGGSWEMFNADIVDTTPGGSLGLDDKMFGFFYNQQERIPKDIKGVTRFESGLRIPEFTNVHHVPRLLMESQFLAFRIHIARLMKETDKDLQPYSQLPFDSTLAHTRAKRIMATGASKESNNMTILNLLANVLGCPIYKRYIRTQQGALLEPTPSVGAAYLARYMMGVKGSFRDMLSHPAVAPNKLGTDVMVAQPDEDEAELYGAMMREWWRLEGVVVREWA